jgi:predicted DNA-binding transcriptional regulator AlpA
MRSFPDKDLLTAQDLARCFSVSARTIWRWRAARKLPAPVRLSSACIRWRARDIERHLGRCR